MKIKEAQHVEGKENEEARGSSSEDLDSSGESHVVDSGDEKEPEEDEASKVAIELKLTELEEKIKRMYSRRDALKERKRSEKKKRGKGNNEMDKKEADEKPQLANKQAKLIESKNKSENYKIEDESEEEDEEHKEMKRDEEAQKLSSEDRKNAKVFLKNKKDKKENEENEESDEDKKCNEFREKMKRMLSKEKEETLIGNEYSTSAEEKESQKKKVEKKTKKDKIEKSEIIGKIDNTKETGKKEDAKIQRKMSTASSSNELAEENQDEIKEREAVIDNGSVDEEPEVARDQAKTKTLNDWFEVPTSARLETLKIFRKNEKTLGNDVKTIEELLKKLLSNPKIFDKNMIENFMVVNKCKIEKAMDDINGYFSMRVLNPNVFKNSNPKSSKMKEIMDALFFIPLPKLIEPNWSRLIVVKFNTSDNFNLCKFLAHAVNVTEIRLREEFMMRDVFIVDLKGFTLEHLGEVTTKWVPDFEEITDWISRRITALHILNAPFFVESLVSFLRALLKGSTSVDIHRSVYSLTQHIPKEFLPKDYGGKQLSLMELNEQFKEKFKKHQKWFDDLASMNLKMFKHQTLTDSE